MPIAAPVPIEKSHRIASISVSLGQ
jgi:hypothetical protein